MVDNDDYVEDVKNESIKSLPATTYNDKHDEFRFNYTRSEFYAYVNHAWNDVYWLAHGIIWMGFIGEINFSPILFTILFIIQFNSIQFICRSSSATSC